MHDEPIVPDDPQDEPAEAAVMAEFHSIGRRRSEEPIAWLDPPEDLWARIHEEIAADEPRRVGSRTRLSVLVAAAAAVLVVLALVSRSISSGPTELEVVAEVELEQLDTRGTGTVELLEGPDHLELRVDTADLDPGDGFLELWMIDPEITRLVSLGPLRPDGIYPVPPGLDPVEYPIIDISIEPLDGDPAHSGDSVLRGRLDV